MSQKNQSVRYFRLLPVLLIGAWGCSSTPKANLPESANPNDEITRLNRDIADGEANDFAVLDQKDFNESKDHLHKAEDKQKDNADQKNVIEELSIARGYYEQAEKTANERRSRMEPVLNSRSDAISAGALQYPQSRERLEKADDQARSLATSNGELKSDDVSKLQEKYGEVQLNALVTNQLGDAKSIIDAAKADGAGSQAPHALNQAKTDYDNAKNAISSNRLSRDNYAAQVKQANLSADTLKRVMEMAKNAKKDHKDFNEDEAIKIVWKDREIHALGAEMSDQQAQKSNLEDRLDQNKMKLGEDEKKVAMQKALQKAQDEFTSDEAEVFQKNNQLLIRLKAVAFDSGSYKLPSASLALLAKTKNVVEELKPESLVIEGHTDSVGAKAKNEKLSEKRAETVAKYFEENGVEESKIKVEGYGDSKPLATNKTKEGRAENRRIDILITPSDTSL